MRANGKFRLPLAAFSDNLSFMGDFTRDFDFYQQNEIFMFNSCLLASKLLLLSINDPQFRRNHPSISILCIECKQMILFPLTAERFKGGKGNFYALSSCFFLL